ncbi:MAG: OB-fold nucleic acid binding domain-containing protein, partial [Candidatus Hodarchaeota archaeon]
MLGYRTIVLKILAVRSDLTEETLHQMIQKKQEATGYLLTEEGATYMVANELGIDLSNGNVIGTIIKVKDLPLGVNDATAVGRVIAISPIQSFQRKDGVMGKVARFMMADETGTVNVVLWDHQTSVVSREEIVPNQIVRISHGYVREGLNGKPELNVGRRGTVVVLSSEKSINMKNPMTRFKTISDLKEGDTFINIRGVVKGISQISSFNRRNNRRGRVARLRLVDETGRIKAVFWDDKVDFVKRLQVGEGLEIEGGRVQKGLGNALEVHVGRFSTIKKLLDSEISKHPPLTFTKIN